MEIPSVSSLVALRKKNHLFFTIPVCWKLELEGNHEMTAEVEVTLEARTHEGPRGASFPMIIVHAASLEVLRLTVTDLTLIR